MATSHLKLAGISALLILCAACIVPYTYSNPRWLVPAHVNPGPDALDLDRFERDLHRVINTYRLEHGAPSVSWDDAIADVARRFSDRMSFTTHTQQFVHGTSPRRRYRSAHPRCHPKNGAPNANLSVAELVAVEPYMLGTPNNRTFRPIDELVEGLMARWLLSPVHREVMLSPTFHVHGVGVVFDADGRIWVTHRFC